MIILKIGGSILTEKDLAEPKVDYEKLFNKLNINGKP